MSNKSLVNLIKDEKFEIVSDLMIAAISTTFPYIGLSAMATKGIFQVILSRTNAYKKSLNSDLVDNLKKLYDNESFVQKFLLTFQSAVKSHNDEKAAAFARLLNGTYKDNVEIDDVFEYTELLNKLSVRDMFLLNILQSMPKGENSSEDDFKLELQEWKNDLSNKTKYDLDFLESIYMKLQGYGLCRRWYHRSFLGQRFNEFWVVTPYYWKFLSYLNDKSNI